MRNDYGRKCKTLVVGALLLLGACAPMPGAKLLPGALAPTPMEHVKVTITKNFWETQIFCNSNLPAHQVILNCILNACVVMGCANVIQGDMGNVTRCDVYVAFPLDFILEHELKHCEGYDDTLY